MLRWKNKRATMWAKGGMDVKVAGKLRVCESVIDSGKRPKDKSHFKTRSLTHTVENRGGLK